jgi:hypothetical protein
MSVSTSSSSSSTSVRSCMTRLRHSWSGTRPGPCVEPAPSPFILERTRTLQLC